MSFPNRHAVEDWLAERAEGGAIVEIGGGVGNGICAMGKGASRGNNMPIYLVDPYKPYVDPLGGTYGPDTIVELQNNTAGIEYTHFQVSAEQLSTTWDTLIALLWIDVSMPYAPLKNIFDLWKGFVIDGGIIAITGATYDKLGTALIGKEAVASGEYDYALHEQDLVVVLTKKKVL